MKSPEIVDRYTQLKYPERYAELSEAWRTGFEKLAAGRSMDELRQDRRALMRTCLAQFDTTILGQLRMTVDDFLDARDAWLARRHGARQLRVAHKDALDAALRAFLEAERHGENSDKAVARAMHEIERRVSNPPEPKTVRAWLKELIDWKATSIKLSKPGRPKKADC